MTTKTESVVTGTTKKQDLSILTPKQILAKFSYKDKESNRDYFVDETAMYKEMSLTDEEARKFLGGKDPYNYFRDGLIHRSMIKLLGERIADEEEEVIAVRRILPTEDFLLFKQKKANVYVILVPKEYSEYEQDDEKNFVNEHIHYDIRVIVFTGAGSPAAYETVYFENKLRLILMNCTKAFENRRLKISR